ncbi:MAG: ABC transporter permease subunit [Lachnospiraceae bacterium]
MISKPLWKRNLWIGIKLMIPFLAILTMYNSVIIWMYDPKLSQSLDEFQQIMPEMMAAVGMTGATGTLIEFLHTYLYGFIMLLIPVIYVVMLVYKLIMKYVEDGSIACILATPNSRRKIIHTQLLSVSFLTTLLIVIMSGIGYGCCEAMFPGDLAVKKYLLLNGATLLLDLAMGGICVLTACICNEAKWYLTIGAGLPLFFYVIQMMSNMGEKLEKLKYATMYTLFPGKEIIKGTGGVILPCLILAGIWLGLHIVGTIIFTKKDLSV